MVRNFSTALALAVLSLCAVAPPLQAGAANSRLQEIWRLGDCSRSFTICGSSPFWQQFSSALHSLIPNLAPGTGLEQGILSQSPGQSRAESTVPRWLSNDAGFVAELNRLNAEAQEVAHRNLRRMRAAAVETVESLMTDAGVPEATRPVRLSRSSR